MAIARKKANRRRMTLPELEQEIARWLETGSHSPDEDLIVDMMHAVLKLAQNETNRGDLKILTRSLKELSYAFKVFAPYRGVRKVSIFGSTRVSEEDPYYKMAVRFGRRLAEEGLMVITGAGEGIMQAGHEGAGREKSFGVNIQLPFSQTPNKIIRDDPKLITFHFFFTRKLIFVKEADAVAFFPGGFGTHDEVIEALTLAQTGKSQIVPILLLDLPDGGYWREWERLVLGQMLSRGYISDHDLRLFKIFEDIESPVQEIKQFYRNYHSYRFVQGELVIRILHSPTSRLIQRLNGEFRDVMNQGEIRQVEAFPEESDDPETLQFPRLLVPFNRRDFGRLREIIDVINGDDL